MSSTHRTELSLLAAAASLSLMAHPGLASAQVPDLPPTLGMKWIEIAPRCHVIADADTGKPILNPYADDAYSVGAYEDCPKKTNEGGNLVTFESTAVSGGAVRFYAPWGRIYVFPFHPEIEGWGYGQKFRFEWVAPENF